MKVSVDTLRTATQILLSHLEECGTNEIEIEDDFYWDIPEKYRYAPNDEPKDFTLGQLSSDFDEITKIASGNQPPIGYALVWLSALLRYAGEKK